MEMAKDAPVIIVDDSKKELKVFKKSFILFLVGQILLIISTLSRATVINGVPRWLSIFELFLYIAYIIYFFALFYIRNLNISFKRSFISLLALFVVFMFYEVSRTSESQFYVSSSRGLGWSIDIVKCIFYLYFFHGCSVLFDKYGFHAGKKKTIIFLSAFMLLFIAGETFNYLSSVSGILKNRFFNRFFLYGSWGLVFLTYVSVFVMTIIIAHYLNKKFKERKEREHEVQDVSK